MTTHFPEKLISPRQKVILCILDGWGVRSDPLHNGVHMAQLPHWNRFLKTYPHTTLQASELFVGLPLGQMGNSEVGHMTIGSGHVHLQDLPQVDQAIASGIIPSLSAYQTFAQKARQGTGVVHLLGLLSPGGIHSHQDHILHFARLLAADGFQVKIHGFLDGRDTNPQEAHSLLSEWLPHLPDQARLVTIAGRYYAMDRDKRWDRIRDAYDCMVIGRDAAGKNYFVSEDFLNTIQSFYTNNVGDEFISPHCSPDYEGIKDGDSLLMVNFRADRVRQILSALLMPDFNEFTRSLRVSFASTLGLFDYSTELTPFIPSLFTKDSSENTLGEIISNHGLRQLRLAETEKYAHVTFFFNGGRELVFPGEDRHLIPSPLVSTYDLKPEMSAVEITNYLVKQIQENIYDLIVVNFANADMVGHTGIVPAILKALETLDTCLERIESAALAKDYVVMVTADHGNVEMMSDPETQIPHTAHTLNPVPCIFINAQADLGDIHTGTLADIAPTILTLMGLEIPDTMTGKPLF